MPVVLRRIDGGNFGFGTLGNAVGIQKLAAQIYDQISPPVHFQPGVFRDLRHLLGLQVLLVGRL